MYDVESKEIKIILLGESGTGKSNLVNICCNLTFNKNSASNISSTILEKKIKISNISYILKFWDTAGQEKFRSLNNIFIKDSKICIFVYDVTREETFKALEYWIKSVKEILGNEMILGLVANKIDLEQKVSKEKGEKLAEDIGAFFLETSAKNNNGEFSEFVEKLVNEFLVKCSIKGWEFIDKDYGERITLSTDNHKKTKRKKCC